MLVTYESAYLYHHEYNVNHLSCHLCSLTIYGLHVFFLQTCFRHGHSPIYGHPWLYTWHVGILDQVCAYMYIYGFDIFSDDPVAVQVSTNQKNGIHQISPYMDKRVSIKGAGEGAQTHRVLLGKRIDPTPYLEW